MAQRFEALSGQSQTYTDVHPAVHCRPYSINLSNLTGR